MGVDAPLVYRRYGGNVRHEEDFMPVGLYFLDKKKVY